MKRRVIRFLFVISGTAFVTAALLCVRGFSTADRVILLRRAPADDIPHSRAYAEWTLASGSGEFRLRVRRRYKDPSIDTPRGTELRYLPMDVLIVEPRPVALAVAWQRWGFGYWRASAAENGWQLAVPAWAVLGALALLTAAPGCWIWFRVERPARRAARGLCAACGYDLRGAAHERCPECGAAVVVAA